MSFQIAMLKELQPNLIANFYKKLAPEGHISADTQNLVYPNIVHIYSYIVYPSKTISASISHYMIYLNKEKSLPKVQKICYSLL